MTNQSTSRSVVGVFLFILVLFALFLGFSFSVLKQLQSSSETDSDSGEGGALSMLALKEKSPIAVVEVNGAIMESRPTIELLLNAESDDSVKAIILRVDSPGGAVGPTQEIFEEIIRIDKLKPIYASFGSIAASGGYYLGSATRKIFASNGTLTGSIGVIMQFMDLSKLYEWAKLKPQTIKAGKYKDIGSPSRSMTEEESKLMNALLESTRQRFMSDVLLKRKGKIKSDLNELAQGQIFSGEEAKSLGLIDEIGGLWQAARFIHKELKIKGEFKNLRFLKPKQEFDLQDFLSDLEEGKSALKNISQFFSSNLNSVPQYKWDSR